jgi:hypothetical protein
LAEVVAVLPGSPDHLSCSPPRTATVAEGVDATVHTDDTIIVAAVRSVVRRSGRPPIDRHRRGSPGGSAALERLARLERAAGH